MQTISDMKRTIQFSLLACLSIAASSLHGHGYMEKEVSYNMGDKTFTGTVTWDDHSAKQRPGILMVPNWMGPTEASLKKAQFVASMGYVVMMVDMYGTDVRPQNSKEAGEAAGAVRGDRALMRERSLKALSEFRALEGIPLKDNDIAAIGFCFGGGTVLELARAGADVDAVISFHGDLVSPTLESDSSNVTAKVLVLHGAEDPLVPQDDVQAFVAAMLPTEADWQLIQFSNTVHSFTDPNASMAGTAEYNPRSASRAFEYMEELLEEMWGEWD